MINFCNSEFLAQIVKGNTAQNPSSFSNAKYCDEDKMFPFFEKISCRIRGMKITIEIPKVIRYTRLLLAMFGLNRLSFNFKTKIFGASAFCGSCGLFGLTFLESSLIIKLLNQQ